MQVPLATMMEEGQEGWGGRREESRRASGVVWNVAPESATHCGPTGVVGPIVLKEYAKAAESEPAGLGETSEGGAHGDAAG